MTAATGVKTPAPIGKKNCSGKPVGQRICARPAATALAVLCLASCSNAAPTSPPYTENIVGGRPTLVVSVTDTVKANFAFRINGIDFVVPNSRLHTILEGDLVARDELWSGFSFYSVLPDISPLTEADVALLSRPSSERNFIVVAVERGCPTSVDPADCDLPNQIATSLDSDSLVPISAEWPIEPVAGLTPLLQERGGGPFEGAAVRDYFAFSDPPTGPHPGHISCSREENVEFPSCEHLLIWRGTLRVKLTYKRSNLDNWQQIYIRSMEVLESISSPVILTDDNPTIYFPKEYYNG